MSETDRQGVVDGGIRDVAPHWAAGALCDRRSDSRERAAAYFTLVIGGIDGLGYCNAALDPAACAGAVLMLGGILFVFYIGVGALA